MEENDTNGMGPGGKASFTALAGAIVFVIGVILAVPLGPIGFFFMVFGGVIVLASPVIWLVLVWDDRSDDGGSMPTGDGRV